MCLSSLAYVVGNRGQSAYTAANTFMEGLVAKRQHRGLAGSVIHIGGIFGEGYLARQLTHERQVTLRKAGFAFMSEQAFHELFAEGVLSSRSAHGSLLADFEISSGLQVQQDNSEANFARNPIFQHIVTSKGYNLRCSHDSKISSSSLPIKELLESLEGDQEAFQILRSEYISILSLPFYWP